MTIRALSYAHGISTTPLLNDTLGGILDKAAERWPGREAAVVRDQNVRMTFAQLRDEVDRLATGLIALGLQPGDRIGLWSPNKIEWVLSQYATAKAGLILVNLNPGYRVAELEYALNKVECRALITADQFKTSNYIGMLRELAPELDDCPPGALRAARVPHLTTVIHMADTNEPGVPTGAMCRGARAAPSTPTISPTSTRVPAPKALWSARRRPGRASSCRNSARRRSSSWAWSRETVR
jgi:fatty-acyl-CoA synthase